VQLRLARDRLEVPVVQQRLELLRERAQLRAARRALARVDLLLDEPDGAGGVKAIRRSRRRRRRAGGSALAPAAAQQDGGDEQCPRC
jgi:hypothetical protein